MFVMSFNKLKLSPWVLATCEKIKYNTPTPIQVLAIPAILDGLNVIINSETGSGKTAAFSLPILNALAKEPSSVYAVVVAPSLELAMQIHQQLSIFGQSINLRLALIVGGVNYDRQIGMLEQYPHIVVGTPGRLSEMLDRCDKFKEDIQRAEVLILDEADRLFEDRLLPSMQSIIASMAGLKQIILATATIDQNFQAKKLQGLLKREVVFEKKSTFEGKKTVATLLQSYIFTPQHLKPGYLLRLLDENQPYKIIVFVKTCKECTFICETLKKLQYSATELHSFMRNSQRIANLAMFRNDVARILVTTDLTARGLDINEVNMVINYNIPKTVADYVHRVGRTARNGAEGQAVTLLTPNQVDIFLEIQQQIHLKIPEHELNDKPDLHLVSKFSKAKREVKVLLMSCGVLADLDRRRDRKVQRRT